jgi:two-component system, NtrC family, response regulator PilR
MSEKNILIVDDEKDIRELLVVSLKRLGYAAQVAEDVDSALRIIRSEQPVDFCLTDIRLPDGSGLEIVQQFREARPEAEIAVMTAYDSTDIAVDAMRVGAFDFLAKPIRLERLKTMLDNALVNPLQDNETDMLIGKSAPMLQLKEYIHKVSRTLAPVLISGESGTGKELVARSIHSKSNRSAGPFIAVNCGAIPSELMESEFFGHVKGSFTGAVSDKEGLFKSAENGTLFLDEIADLPLLMQVKLLRAIQEKSIRPVGGQKEIATNVRILSATHRNLETEVQEGRFRQDLFYRLNVIGIEVPPLCERKEDIPRICISLLQRHNASEQNNISMTDEAIEELQQYPFPGNVRELENIIHRAAALCDDGEITDSDLNFIFETVKETDLTTDYSSIRDLEGHLASVERDILMHVLEELNWNRKETAKRLGLSERQLRYKLVKYQLSD